MYIPWQAGQTVAFLLESCIVTSPDMGFGGI